MQGIKLYNHLKKKISEILINNNSNVFTYSISLLNVIKAHPYHLKKYVIINETDKLRNIKIFFLELYYFLKFFHYFFDKQIIYKQKKFSNIFISHYMNKAQNLNKDPNYIINKNSLVVYINHTNKKIYNNRLNKCVVLARRLNLIDELKIIKNQLIERKRLLKKYNRKKDFFIRLVAADAISPSTITNNRIANQIKNLIKYYKPKNFITTFEGYSWEKIVIYFANNLKYKCVTFGYIPNLLLKNYGSNVIKYKHIFYPRKILVSGSYTKQKICNLKHLRNKVHNIGTIKNFPSKFKLNKIKNNNILVIPE